MLMRVAFFLTRSAFGEVLTRPFASEPKALYDKALTEVFRAAHMGLCTDVYCIIFTRDSSASDRTSVSTGAQRGPAGGSQICPRQKAPFGKASLLPACTTIPPQPGNVEASYGKLTWWPNRL